jgi:hypothetical protein
MLARSQDFADSKITLDGSSFYSCGFNRCTLIYAGLLPVQLDNCRFNDCKWEFTGAASNTVGFMRAMHSAGATALIEATFEQIRGKSPSGNPVLK